MLGNHRLTPRLQNLLRQYTHPDYYKTRVISWEDPEDILRTHVGMQPLTS